MKTITQFKVGGVGYEIHFEEKTDKETLNLAITLSNPPRYCQECGNAGDLFVLDTNRDTEGNIYINMKCMKQGCYAKAKLGSYKTGGYFWHKFEKYQPEKELGVRK